jgi:hypothetical protein
MQTIRYTSSQIERERERERDSAHKCVCVCASYEETCDVAFECCQSYMSVIIQRRLYCYVACVCVCVCLYACTASG